MIVRATRNDLKAALGKSRRQHPCVAHDILTILCEGRLQRLPERNSLCGDDMLKRTTLHSGKDRLVDSFGVFGLAEDDATTWSTKRFMCGTGDHVGERNRRGINASCREPCKVRHVDHEQRADFLGNISERLPVDGARIRTVAGDDHLGFVLAGRRAHLLVIDDAVVGYPIRHGLVQQTREIHRRAMREVATLRKVHAEECVARLEKREKHGGVRGSSAVRLHVCVIRTEQLLRAIDRKLLDLVDHFTATVVALARQPFRVLVRQRRTHRLHDGRRHEILAGDQFDGVALALNFLFDQMRNFRICTQQCIAGRATIPQMP